MPGRVRDQSRNRSNSPLKLQEIFSTRASKEKDLLFGDGRPRAMSVAG
jgi:hypothetical protein